MACMRVGMSDWSDLTLPSHTSPPSHDQIETYVVKMDAKAASQNGSVVSHFVFCDAMEEQGWCKGRARMREAG